MKRHSVADICGLEKGSNGRSCAVHPVCGTIVAAGDKLLLQAVVVDMIQANPKEQKKRMAGFIEEEVSIAKEPACNKTDGWNGRLGSVGRSIGCAGRVNRRANRWTARCKPSACGLGAAARGQTQRPSELGQTRRMNRSASL